VKYILSGLVCYVAGYLTCALIDIITEQAEAAAENALAPKRLLDDLDNDDPRGG
jgi:hypothetical protein